MTVDPPRDALPPSPYEGVSDLEAEQARAIECIVTSPEVMVGIDYFIDGSGQDWRDYKFLKIAGIALDPVGSPLTTEPEVVPSRAEAMKASGIPAEQLDEFKTMLMYREHDFTEVNPAEYSGVHEMGSSYVAGVQAEDGTLTYLLVFVSPEAGLASRAEVRMVMTVGPSISAPLASALDQVNERPGLLLDIFRGIAGDTEIPTGMRHDKLRDLVTDIAPPITLSVDEGAAVRKLIIAKRDRQRAERARRDAGMTTRFNTPPPKRRFFGDRRR